MQKLLVGDTYICLSKNPGIDTHYVESKLVGIKWSNTAPSKKRSTAIT